MVADYINLFMGIHEKQNQDCETSSVLAVLSWENATCQSEENKHSLAIGVKDVTDYFLFFFYSKLWFFTKTAY